ncbi:MAG TPA: flagellar motor switch protein FliM [Bacillota bacterium]
MTVGRVAAKPRNIRLYDFRRPDKFSKEQIRTLQMLHDNFARALTTVFTTHLRTGVDVAVTAVQQMTYGEFIGRVDDPAVLAVVELEPLAGTGLFEFDPGLVYPMLDRLFGGPGQSAAERRPLTDIEQSVMERVVEAALEALAGSWSNLVHLQPSLRTIESNPAFTHIVAPNEVCVIITFEVRLGAHRGRMQLCLPYIVLEPVVPKLSTQHWFAAERKVQRVEQVGAELERVVVGVWVRLGKATVTLRELLDLEPGDLLQLERRHGQPVEVFVEDQPTYRALPGRRGNRLAVRIEAVLEDAGRSDLT